MSGLAEIFQTAQLLAMLQKDNPTTTSTYLGGMTMEFASLICFMLVAGGDAGRYLWRVGKARWSSTDKAYPRPVLADEDASFRQLVIGTHTLACFMNVVGTMMVGIVSGLDTTGSMPNVQATFIGIALASAAMVFVIEMRIRHNEVFRALRATVVAQQAGARDLAVNLHAPLHASWLGLHLLMNEFAYKEADEYASKYAVLQNIMGGCLAAMSLVNDPTYSPTATTATAQTTHATKPNHTPTLGDADDLLMHPSTHPFMTTLPTRTPPSSFRPGLAPDPMGGMACTRHTRLDTLLADCLLPAVIEARQRGVVVRLNGRDVGDGTGAGGSGEAGGTGGKGGGVSYGSVRAVVAARIQGTGQGQRQGREDALAPSDALVVDKVRVCVCACVRVSGSLRPHSHTDRRRYFSFSVVVVVCWCSWLSAASSFLPLAHICSCCPFSPTCVHLGSPLPIFWSLFPAPTYLCHPT